MNQKERAELKRLAQAVREHWREQCADKPPGTPDAISTPGMLLLAYIEGLP